MKLLQIINNRVKNDSIKNWRSYKYASIYKQVFKILFSSKQKLNLLCESELFICQLSLLYVNFLVSKKNLHWLISRCVVCVILGV